MVTRNAKPTSQNPRRCRKADRDGPLSAAMSCRRPARDVGAGIEDSFTEQGVLAYVVINTSRSPND
jgi:hypothetical protein